MRPSLAAPYEALASSLELARVAASSSPAWKRTALVYYLKWARAAALNIQVVFPSLVRVAGSSFLGLFLAIARSISVCIIHRLSFLELIPYTASGGELFILARRWYVYLGWGYFLLGFVYIGVRQVLITGWLELWLIIMIVELLFLILRSIELILLENLLYVSLNRFDML